MIIDSSFAVEKNLLDLSIFNKNANKIILYQASLEKPGPDIESEILLGLIETNVSMSPTGSA
jgi:hypothetical protein